MSSLQCQFVPPSNPLIYWVENRKGEAVMSKTVCCFCVSSPLCIISFWFPPGSLSLFPTLTSKFYSISILLQLVAPFPLNLFTQFFTEQHNLFIWEAGFDAPKNKSFCLRTPAPPCLHWNFAFTKKSLPLEKVVLLLIHFSFFLLFWKFTSTAKQHLWNACCWHGQNTPPLGNVVSIHPPHFPRCFRPLLL